MQKGLENDCGSFQQSLSGVFQWAFYCSIHREKDDPEKRPAGQAAGAGAVGWLVLAYLLFFYHESIL